MVDSVDYDVDPKDYLDFFDFPLEDIDGSSDKDFWNGMQSLELPSDMSMCFSSGLCGGIQNDFNDNKNISMSYDRTCRPNEFPSGAGAVLSDDSSSDVKPTHLFKSSSPVSILESTSSCFTENPRPTAAVPAKRARTKRSRSRPSNFTKLHTLPLVWAAKSFASETATLLSGKSAPKKKRAPPLLSPPVSSDSGPSGEGKRCTHCEVTSTPQWREGPMGPKTLCNACGVRFRSGRLFPEYRPAASPTFVASVHSNSHKKVVEMRSKAERGDGDGRAGVQLYCRSQAGDSVWQLIV